MALDKPLREMGRAVIGGIVLSGILRTDTAVFVSIPNSMFRLLILFCFRPREPEAVQ